jgi:hypothetical protein
MSITLVRLGSLCAIAASCLQARAAIVVTGDPADASIRKGTIVNGINAKRIGAGTSSPSGSRVGVFVFLLPTPGPGELPIVSSADFALNIQTNFAGATYNLDLYGLNARAAPDVLITDGYVGTSDNKAPALIQDNFVPIDNTLTGFMHPSAAGDSALAKYLTGQYGADGSGAGKYVFFRLNSDIDPPSENTGVDVSMAEDSMAPPLLTITLVPEPGILVFGILSLALSMRRRRCR